MNDESSPDHLPKQGDAPAPQERPGEHLDQDTITVLTDYFLRIQTMKKEQESGFDKAVLIVAGGAFTVSAAFVPQLEEPLTAGWSLVASWVAWAACLILSIYGFLFSANCHDWVLKQLSAGVTDVEQLKCEKAKWIPRFNQACFGLLVIGFIGFGIFTYANLDFEGERRGEGKEEIQKESEQTNTPPLPDEAPGIGRTGSAPDVPPPQATHQVGGNSNAEGDQATRPAPGKESRAERKTDAESPAERAGANDGKPAPGSPTGNNRATGTVLPTSGQKEGRHDRIERSRPAAELAEEK